MSLGTLLPLALAYLAVVVGLVAWGALALRGEEHFRYALVWVGVLCCFWPLLPLMHLLFAWSEAAINRERKRRQDEDD
jgi:ABC-type proline/glycine betaine transport system permease subunit